MNVGAMKDSKLELRNLHVLDALEFVYYESIKREVKTKLIYECRCDERLKTKVEESARLGWTVLHDKTN